MENFAGFLGYKEDKLSFYLFGFTMRERERESTYKGFSIKYYFFNRWCSYLRLVGLSLLKYSCAMHMTFFTHLSLLENRKVRALALENANAKSKGNLEF